MTLRLTSQIDYKGLFLMARSTSVLTTRVCLTQVCRSSPSKPFKITGFQKFKQATRFKRLYKSLENRISSNLYPRTKRWEVVLRTNARQMVTHRTKLVAPFKVNWYANPTTMKLAHSICPSSTTQMALPIVIKYIRIKSKSNLARWSIQSSWRKMVH